MPLSPFSRRPDHGGGDRGDALDRAPLLAVLDTELRRLVRKRLNRRKIAAGKPVFRQGEPADALYLIESGRFRVYVGDRLGKERVLRFLGAGQTIGESAFMAETAYVTTAVAEESGSVWRLARTDFEALLGGHEGALHYLAGVIGQQQAQADARLAAETTPNEVRPLRGYVTAVYSPRGGAGVTTLALNTAVALAERNPEDTVLFDLDALFGHATANLWLEPRGVLAHLSPTTMYELDRPGLDVYLVRHQSSLRVLAGTTRPDVGESITADHVRASVTTLRRNFGYIVLDLPHTFHELTLVGLELADKIVLVGTPEQVTLHDIVDCRRIFGDILHLGSDRLTCVLNHPLPYSTLNVNDFSNATGTPWLESRYGGDAPTTAAVRGESLLNFSNNNPVAHAAIHLADRIQAEARESAALAGQPRLPRGAKPAAGAE